MNKVLRFLTGGGSIWLLRALLTTALTEGLEMDPVWAYRVGLSISFVLYFFMNLHFIFQVQDQLLWRLVKYTLVSLSFLSTDGLLMQFFYEQWGWHYQLSLSASTLILLGVKFVVYNYLVFNPSRSKA